MTEIETFEEQKSRVEMIGDDDGETWDLSERDHAAIRAVLMRLSEVEAERHHFKELYRIADIEVDTLRADQERMREALQQHIKAAVSTRTILQDFGTFKTLGHNPSWVKAADVEAALSTPRQP